MTATTVERPGDALEADGLVRAVDARTGCPGTWRLTDGPTAGTVVLEWAYGHITTTAGWRAATKVATVTPREHAEAVLRRVVRTPATHRWAQAAR